MYYFQYKRRNVGVYRTLNKEKIYLWREFRAIDFGRKGNSQEEF